MFEKIQHPKTGKWHKTSSAIGSKLIKNYSKKLKLTGGAMDLQPGQDIWYYTNEINKELNYLRENLKLYSTNPLANIASIEAINNAFQVVQTTEIQLSDINGPFGATMQAYFSGQAPPNESARLKQETDYINANKQALSQEIGALREIATLQHQQQEQQAVQLTYQQQQQAAQLAYQQQQQQAAQLAQQQQAAQLAYQQQQQQAAQLAQQQAQPHVPSWAPLQQQLAADFQPSGLFGPAVAQDPRLLPSQPDATAATADADDDDEVQYTGEIGADERLKLAQDRGEVIDVD